VQKRPLGKSGISIAPLVFGGNVFGWTADEKTSFALLDVFVDGGFDCIDTADMYSRWVTGNTGGESETVIGNWLKRSGKRDKVIIATKVGSDMGEGRKGLAKSYILRAVEDSLRRLQTDRIDLYQEHLDDEAAPVEETMDAFATLVRQGKVRAVGASNISPARLRESFEISARHGWPRYETLQPHYNLVERAGYERDYEPIVREQEIGVITYWSLASGFLTGKYRSEADLQGKARADGVKKYMDTSGLAVLSALNKVAAAVNGTPAQVALAWLLARPSVTAPIVSATSVAQWQELARTAEINLSPDAIETLNAASAS
jgi:aryl-alcohol dehydrogenase-like predicted oxidoreductase